MTDKKQKEIIYKPMSKKQINEKVKEFRVMLEDMNPTSYSYSRVDCPYCGKCCIINHRRATLEGDHYLLGD